MNDRRHLLGSHVVEIFFLVQASGSVSQSFCLQYGISLCHGLFSEYYLELDEVLIASLPHAIENDYFFEFVCDGRYYYSSTYSDFPSFLNMRHFRSGFVLIILQERKVNHCGKECINSFKFGNI